MTSFYKTRKIDKIIIHCSATSPDMDIGVAEIKKWHTDPKPKGNGWKNIGYHDVIRRDGRIEQGRAIDDIGAHTKGHNANSIGICMVGGVDKRGKATDNFTPEQWRSLEKMVRFYKTVYKGTTVHGHREFDSGKECPSFDVQKWLKSVNV